MKMVFALIALFLTLGAWSQQQSKVTLYAYEQPVTPGIQKARDIDENGNSIPVKGSGLMHNYMLYAVSPSAARVYPVALWLKGERYGVKLNTVVQTPVTFTTGTGPANPQGRVLVPKTAHKVFQLIPSERYAEKAFPAAERLAASNEVVFVFKQGGKFYYQMLPTLARLEAAALQ